MSMYHEHINVNPGVVKPLKLNIYVDTVDFWIDTPVKRAQVLEWGKGCIGKPNFSYKPMLFKPWWRQQVTLNQPSNSLLNNLDSGLTDKNYMINRLDAAFDIECETQLDAFKLMLFLVEHLNIKGVHKLNIKQVYNGIYFDERKAKRNVVLYSDKPSKVSGRPCCHLEIKIIGKPMCNKLGFDNFSDFTAENLLKLMEDKLEWLVPKFEYAMAKSYFKEGNSKKRIRKHTDYRKGPNYRQNWRKYYSQKWYRYCRMAGRLRNITTEQMNSLYVRNETDGSYTEMGNEYDWDSNAKLIRFMADHPNPKHPIKNAFKKVTLNELMGYRSLCLYHQY